MRNKGIVVKTKDSYCIILAGDGTYHKIPRSRVSNPTVGAESEFYPANWVNRLKPVLMVACLLIAVLSLNFYHMAASADPAAYVSLDINPSMELGVDKNSRVVTVLALNQDAENLLKGLDIKGKDLYLSVRQILDSAAASGYIRPEEVNYILSTVTPVDNSSNVINYDKMADNLQKSVENKDLDVNFVILSADNTTRQEAMNKGISAGKLLVYKNSINSGTKLSLEQVKQTSVTTLVRNHKVLLLPGNKKGFVKLIRIPRKKGHLRKSSSTPQNDTSAVNRALTAPVKETNDEDKPLKRNRVIKPKPGGKDKTKRGDSLLIKFREILDFDQQNNTSTPDKDTGNTDNSSDEKQGGKNKKSRPAGSVKKIDVESQDTTNPDNTHEKYKGSDTRANSPEKQKNNTRGNNHPSGKKTDDSVSSVNPGR